MSNNLDKIPRCIQLIEEIENWRLNILKIFNKYKIKSKNCWINGGGVIGMREEQPWGSSCERRLDVYLFNDDENTVNVRSFYRENNKTYASLMKESIIDELKKVLERKAALVDKRIKETSELIHFIDKLETNPESFDV